MSYGCDSPWEVHFENRHTGERCDTAHDLTWRAGFNYLISLPSFGSMIVDVPDGCCPDCVPTEGDFDLVFIDLTDDYEAWRGPVTFVSEQEGELIINARDSTWWAWNARRWSQDRNLIGVDAATLLAETLREAEVQGDATGIDNYLVQPTGIESDLIAPLYSPLSKQLGLQTAVAQYTYVGNRTVLVGDITTFDTEANLLPEHWNGGAPQLARSLDAIATEVVVTNPSGTIVGIWPPALTASDAIAAQGSVISRQIEVNDLQTEAQATAIARAQWARLQSPFQILNPSGVTLNQRFPVSRRNLIPGLTVEANELGTCLPTADAAVRVQQVDFEISNGVEEAVEIDIAATQISVLG